MSVLCFQVRGIPGAQGSKRAVGNNRMVESSPKVAPWRQDVRAAAEAALIASDDWPARCDTPVHIAVVFTFTRPKAHYRTGKLAGQLRDDAPVYVTSRGKGDGDKLLRSTFDALTSSGVIVDDSLFVTGRFSKVYGDTPGAHLILATDSEVTA